MASIDADNLTFVDVNQDKWGSFVEPENLDKFMASPVGEAQVESLVEEMKAQMVSQGVDDYAPSTSQIRRALFSEQAAQEYGRAPDVTNQQMLDDHGPAWYEELGGSIAGLFKSADEAISDGVHSGVDATVQQVTNEGMTGRAADALLNRQQQIDDAVNGAVSGGSTMKL